MNTTITSLAWTAFLLALWMTPPVVKAQTPRQQAEKELERKAPNAGVEACSLITRADVKTATGRDPFVDPESAGQGGDLQRRHRRIEGLFRPQIVGGMGVHPEEF
jgi:hypothetical protein